MKQRYIILIVFSFLSIFSTQAEWFDKCGQLFSRGAGYWSTPKDESNTSFFGKLTDAASQREDWYSVTPYCAEFWCTLSNAGFLYVGAKHKSPELIFAGLASIASHSIPKQSLLYVDKLGVLVVLSLFARKYQSFIDNPKLLIPVLGLGAINFTDMYMARQKGKTWPHVVWHLSAALVADYVLSSIKD